MALIAKALTNKNLNRPSPSGTSSTRQLKEKNIFAAISPGQKEAGADILTKRAVRPRTKKLTHLLEKPAVYAAKRTDSLLLRSFR